MTNKEIWKRFDALPAEAQQQVGDFISFLHARLAAEPSAPPALSGEAKGSFFGMWADRDDRADSDWADSRARVRALREREWASHR